MSIPAIGSSPPLLRHPVHTYSIVARDPRTGELGVGVQSHYFSVGSVVPWAEAGVGAVATQSFVRVDYGPEGLALMRGGLSAPQALERLLANDPEREMRQVAMVDAAGNVAVHTGQRCIPAAGHLVGAGFAVQGNLLTNPSVWPAMKAGFASAAGDLAERILAGLLAAEAAGGDLRGCQSAALLVVAGPCSERPWQGRVFDLRVEDHSRPLEELRRLVRLRRAYLLADEAERLLALGRVDEARATFAQAVDAAPEVAEIRFWFAVALVQTGQEAEAIEHFAAVFAAEPSFADLAGRLPDAGLLPPDPGLLGRIAALRGRART